jgi:hypothetical protein
VFGTCWRVWQILNESGQDRLKIKERSPETQRHLKKYNTRAAESPERKKQREKEGEVRKNSCL